MLVRDRNERCSLDHVIKSLLTIQEKLKQSHDIQTDVLYTRSEHIKIIDMGYYSVGLM